MKKWSVQDIKEVLNEMGKKFDFPCDNIPVVISKRMTSCKGYFNFKYQRKSKSNGMKIVPVQFTFASELLDGRYDEDVVRETIIHEYVHFYVNVKFNQRHGHDATFKAHCIVAGISPDTYFTAKPNIDIDNGCNKAQSYKEVYVVRCTCCKKVVATRTRACKLTAHPEMFTSTCCRSKINISRERRAA